MTQQVIISSKGVKITFREGKHKWYAEYTRQNHENDESWNQWGETIEYLGKTVKIIEDYVELWIERFGG